MIVANVWSTNIIGCLSLQIHQKLKLLRSVLKEKFRTPIQVTVQGAEKALSAIHADLHAHPLDAHLVTANKACAQNLAEAKQHYASFLQQRAKLSWLKYGDENTKFFHRSINHRRTHNKINMI